MFVYISSWQHFDTSAGLGLYDFDPETGKLTFIKMVSDISCNVTKVDKNRNVLYMINETDKLPWTKVGGGGRILGFKINSETGDLTQFCERESYSPNPCQLSLDSTGKYMVVANHASHASVTKVVKDSHGKFGYILVYDDAPLDLFPVDEEGRIGEPLDIVIRDGEGPLISQQHSMLHTTEFAPNGEFFVVSDIGADRVYTFAIDKERNLLQQRFMFNDEPGSAPRYCVFHPTLPYLYLNHEGGTKMDVLRFRYWPDGRLEEVDRVSAVDADYVKDLMDEQQGFVMHPSGKYIYDCLRGPDEVAVFEIDQETGALHRIQNQKVEGSWVRGCTLSPDGRFLLVLCMMSGDIQVFAVGEDGKLTPTEHAVKQKSCSWATFYGE